MIPFKNREENIKVSIIILTYNHEKYIKQALDSVLMQDVNFEYEILIGDDCSTDKTLNILENYESRYPNKIKLFKNHKNRGATKNGYNLLTKAKGEYIATCEGDDYWLSKDKLKLQVDFLDKHPQFIGCSHKCLIVNEDGTPTKLQKLSWVKNKEKFTLADFKGIYLPGQVSTIVRRNIYLDNKKEKYEIFYKAHRNIGDRTTGLIYLSKGDFYNIDGVLSAYRILNKSRKNLTSIIFSGENSILNEIMYTRYLEDYSKNVLNVDAGFEYYKRRLLLDSFIYLLRNPCKHNLSIFKEVLSNIDNKIFAITCIPSEFIKKICRKMTCEV